MTIKRKLTNSNLYTKATKNNLDTKDLNEILNLAEKITLNDLDFEKTFNEQGAILCDIKKMLNSKNTNNKAFQCNPIIKNKLNNAQFNSIFQKFKQGKIPSTQPKSKAKSKPKSKAKVIKKKITKTFIKHSNTNYPSKHKSKPKMKISNKKTKAKTKDKTKAKTEINSRYPIVIIKKRGPRKNVFYQNNL
jgi:hypothetical protein